MAMSCLLAKAGSERTSLQKMVHYTSRRQRRPFLALNCATLTEKSSGKRIVRLRKRRIHRGCKSKPGLVEIADGGTLFLDEITEMTTNLQAKLLKVIEDGDFFRVGGTKAIKVDVRFLGATNQNLNNLISEGQVQGRLILPAQRDGDLYPSTARTPGGYRAVEPIFPCKTSAEI